MTHSQQTTLSTHVLDSVLGRPAAGMAVTLTDPDGRQTPLPATDAQGRSALDGELSTGTHTLTFSSGDWFAAQDRDHFHPEIPVTFTVTPGEHHHLALLLSPFSYTTYRGSR